MRTGKTPMWSAVAGGLVSAIAAAFFVLAAIRWSDQGWFSANPEAPPLATQDRILSARRNGLRTLLNTYPNAQCAANLPALTVSARVIARIGPPRRDPKTGWTLPLLDTKGNQRDASLKDGIETISTQLPPHPVLFQDESKGWTAVLNLDKTNGLWNAQVLSASPWGPGPDQFEVICSARN